MLRPEETITTVNPGWCTGVVVYPVQKAVGKVLLGKHMRGPFVGIFDGPGGKFEKVKDTDMPACAARETREELGCEGMLDETRLSLIGVLVCLNEGSKTNRWVPAYTYEVDSEEELPIVQGADGMEDIAWYTYDRLPTPLKGGTQELIDHISSGSEEVLFLQTNNQKIDELITFQTLEVLSPDQYRGWYTQIMN